MGLKPIVHADTAGAAADVAARQDPSEAAIASSLAGEIYGLQSLRADVADQANNTTRFVVMRREPVDPDPGQGPVITSFVFRVRSVPAALYKALGGFATNGVNITKLESYIVDGSFSSPSSMPISTAIRRSSRCAWRWRSWGSSPARFGSSASIRPRRSAIARP